jgi:hypothetical protein
MGRIGGITVYESCKLLYLRTDVSVCQHSSFGKSGSAASVLEKCESSGRVVRFFTVPMAIFD